MCNIATVSWLMKALGANLPLKKLKTFHPSDMISFTEETASEFHRKYDIYSDSYRKNVSTEQLKSILNAMDEKVGTKTEQLRHVRTLSKNFFVCFSSKELENLNRPDIYQLEIDLAGDQAKPANMFRLATALFYKAAGKCAKRMEIAEQLFKFRGGKVKEGIDQLSHIFVDLDAFDVDEFLRKYNTSRDVIKEIRVVSFEWIIQCFNLNRKRNVKAFQFAI